MGPTSDAEQGFPVLDTLTLMFCRVDREGDCAESSMRNHEIRIPFRLHTAITNCHTFYPRIPAVVDAETDTGRVL